VLNHRDCEEWEWERMHGTKDVYVLFEGGNTNLCEQRVMTLTTSKWEELISIEGERRE